mgnify:CR=1 FL=1
MVKIIAKNIPHVVSEALDADPVLRLGFERNLISPGTLATHIGALHQDINKESLRTAIRRLKRSGSRNQLLENAERILAQSYLHVRSNIIKIVFKNEESTLQIINKTFKLNELYNNDLFRLIKGHSVLNAICEETHYDKIESLFSGKIENVFQGLSEFIIVMPKESMQTPGTLMTLTNELTLSNINIVEQFSSGGEVNIIVDGGDSQRTFNILSSLITRCRERHQK